MFYILFNKIRFILKSDYLEAMTSSLITHICWNPRISKYIPSSHKIFCSKWNKESLHSELASQAEPPVDQVKSVSAIWTNDF